MRARTIGRFHKLSPHLLKLDRRFFWIGLGVITLFLNKLFQWNPTFTEIIYSRGLFLGVRYVWDYTLGQLPFPVLYLLIPVLALITFWRGRKALRNYRQVKWRYRVGSFALSLLAFFSAFFFLFQFLWGFNYHRVPVVEQFDLQVEAADTLGVIQEYGWATQRVLHSRSLLPSATDRAILPIDLPENLETVVRTSLEQVFREAGYPVAGRVRGRQVNPDGFLLRMGASGIYIPFVGEGHIDDALASATKPFTLAHELAHGYGIGDEGSANFLAYLACKASSDPLIQYSGDLAYWRYAARSLALWDRQAFQQSLDSLDSGIREDLKAIRTVFEKYPDFLPSFNDLVYDSYLKSQGVQEGKLSYGKLVGMVRAYRKQHSLTG